MKLRSELLQSGINCQHYNAQLVRYDEFLKEKNDEISRLKARIRELENSKIPRHTVANGTAKGISFRLHLLVVGVVITVAVYNLLHTAYFNVNNEWF